MKRIRDASLVTLTALLFNPGMASFSQENALGLRPGIIVNVINTHGRKALQPGFTLIIRSHEIQLSGATGNQISGLNLLYSYRLLKSKRFEMLTSFRFENCFKKTIHDWQYYPSSCYYDQLIWGKTSFQARTINKIRLPGFYAGIGGKLNITDEVYIKIAADFGMYYRHGTIKEYNIQTAELITETQMKKSTIYSGSFSIGLGFKIPKISKH